MNFSSFNSFKRNNFFSKFAKTCFKNNNQFKMFSTINPQKKLTNLKNLFFAQNILQIAKFNYIVARKFSSCLILSGVSQDINEMEEEDTGVVGLMKCDNDLLSKYSLLCEGK